MNRTVLFRIFLDSALFVTIINGWWFVAFPLVIIGAWRFYYTIEIVLAGIMYDALFGMVPAVGVWGYAGTITAFGILIILHVLKKVVR
ncbi:MAG TPA: hypothetical protein VL335_03640 [Candidatus Paceibacterota bacterium]|jgi:hypothetical protein|nr:hypothetical protein [Candidatus Paceibacterota bacterium]